MQYIKESPTAFQCISLSHSLPWKINNILYSSITVFAHATILDEKVVHRIFQLYCKLL